MSKYFNNSINIDPKNTDNNICKKTLEYYIENIDRFNELEEEFKCAIINYCNILQTLTKAKVIKDLDYPIKEGELRYVIHIIRKERERFYDLDIYLGNCLSGYKVVKSLIAREAIGKEFRVEFREKLLSIITILKSLLDRY